MRVLLKAGVGDFHGFGDTVIAMALVFVMLMLMMINVMLYTVDGDGDSDVCSNYNDNMISDDNNFFVLNSNNINGN